MASKPNGHNVRRNASWVEAFIEHTNNLESPKIYRKWAGIATIAAVLEQKVWLTTSARLYPNVYVFLVGHPGVGKTRTINAATAFVRELPDFHLAPTSMTMASLVDALTTAKRTVIQLPDPPMEYNTMFIAADELSAFMHKFDDEIIGGLTTFYDPNVPYGQNRRGNDLKIKIKHPQLNILSGTTPSNLMKFMPEVAWDQGFTSRVVMVFSDERIIGDMFANPAKELPTPMLHDLRIINSLAGQFNATQEYQNLINTWRHAGCPPVTTHPKLVHYNTRRPAHILKLSMIAAIDRGNVLTLTRDDFNTAMNWLVEAEATMPEVFKAGGVGADAKAMDEIYHFIMAAGVAPEGAVIRFASQKVPAHSVIRVLGLMERSGQIAAVSVDPKTGLRNWRALAPGENLLTGPQ